MVEESRAVVEKTGFANLKIASSDPAASYAIDVSCAGPD